MINKNDHARQTEAVMFAQVTTTKRTVGGTSKLATLTVIGRLRGAKYLWVFVGIVVFSLALSVARLSAIRLELNAGDLGFDVQRQAQRAQIGAVSPSRWPALHPGDWLRTINDKPFDPEDFFKLRAALPLGPVTIGVERDGVPLEMHGEVAPLSLISGLALVVRWLTGAVLFILAVGIFLLRPGAKLSWLFFWFVSQIASIMTVGPGLPAPTAVVLGFSTLVFALAPVSGFHFFAHFPTPRTAVRFVAPMYVAAVGLWLLTTVAVNTSALAALGVTLSGVLRAFCVVVALLLVALVATQWRSAVKQHDARLIAITRTLGLATSIGLVVPLLAYTLVRVLGIEGGLAHQISALSVLLFAGTTAMVLVRHNPLEIDRFGASIIGYIVTLGGLGGLFAFALFTLPLVLRRLGFANSSEALVALTALTFISVGPVYRRLRRGIDKWFSREQADALQTSDVLRRIADSVQNDPREKSLLNIVEATTVMGAQSAALWQVDASGRSLHRVLWYKGNPEAPFIARGGPLEKAFEKAGAVEGLGPVTTLPIETQEALWEIDLAMSAPVRAHGVPVGFLGVGRRPSGFGYREEDLSFLETLASQAGLALERGEVITQIGRYRVEKRLAQGGMAEVFVAWQLGLGGFERKVALKRLLPELAEDPQSAAGLLDEARITARLQHHNIAQVYEVGLEAGQHFIAMEFVDGPPLRTLISNQKRAGVPTPLPVSLNLARGLLGALDHAHQLADANGELLHVVHRDVTPANVLVSSRGEAKLVDFGLVLASTRLFRTQTGVSRGTVPYMSPEQSLHEDTIDLRADVYSAAATLYELFCGERAFPEGPKGKLPPSLSTANGQLPGALDAVFARAFATDPQVRFSSAGAFWEAIRAATVPTPIAEETAVAAWVLEYRAQPDFKPKALEGTRSVVVPGNSAQPN